MLEQLAADDQLTAEPRPTAPHVVSERLGHARVTMTLERTRTCCPTCNARPPRPSARFCAGAVLLDRSGCRVLTRVEALVDNWSASPGCAISVYCQIGSWSRR